MIGKQIIKAIKVASFEVLTRELNYHFYYKSDTMSFLHTP